MNYDAVEEIINSESKTLKEVLIKYGLENTIKFVENFDALYTLIEEKLMAVSELIGGFGFNTVYDPLEDMKPLYEYVEMGDEDLQTVLYDYKSKNFICSSYRHFEDNYS